MAKTHGKQYIRSYKVSGRIRFKWKCTCGSTSGGYLTEPDAQEGLSTHITKNT